MSATRSEALVAVREAPHSRHHAEHIVVRRKHVHGRGGRGANGVVGDRQQEGRVINAR